MRLSSAGRSLFCAVCLSAGVVVLFLDSGASYFFGDSIALLWNRPHSWDALVLDFARLDGAHWFRPLSNSMPPFVLWRWFGTNFEPYHVVAMALHLAVSLGLFKLFHKLFRDHAAAFVGAAFFAFHPVQFYATYDIAFYQEPIMAGFALGALILLSRYADGYSSWLLGVGLLCFILALCAKETAVMLPGVLLLVLWGRFHTNARPLSAILAVSAVAGAFTLFYVRVMGVVFRYQDQYRPRLHFQTLEDFGLAVKWALGVPAGWQTEGWQYPAAIHFVLWAVFLGALAVAAFFPRSGLWRGPAWFLITVFPALLTQHLLPHHIYFPLIGVAFLAGGAFGHVRRHLPRVASAAAAAALSGLFVASYLSARGDAVKSWVGSSAREAHAVSQFVRASGLRLNDAAGLMVRTGNAPHLSFAWMSGDIFNLLGDENLEVQLVQDWPAKTPEGFYLLDYRDQWLWNLTPASPGLPVKSISSPIELRLEPIRVRAGADSYCMEIPALSGQVIDFRYRYNQRFPRISYRIASLNSDGRACLPVAANVPWGTTEVIGARVSGSLPWFAVQAYIHVLP